MTRSILDSVRRLLSSRAPVGEPGEAPTDLVRELRERLTAWERGWPPGHFYSPIPDLDAIRRRESVVFGAPPPVLPGIAFNQERQLELLDRLAVYYPEMPFQDQRQPGIRFFFDNPNFSYGEAIVLFCMIGHLRPKQVIEIGSGYSSCALLDASDRLAGGRIDCTFIEPYPDLFLSLLAPGDAERLTLLRQPLQEVPVELFSCLGDGDILFVDSSHVSKVDSDVNRILFEILPRLAAGVYVHFHDIMYPFEYPREWIYQGRAWNEAYLLRAFLQYNGAFSIEFFNSYLGQLHSGGLASALPLCARNPGTSLWLRKLAPAWAE